MVKFLSIVITLLLTGCVKYGVSITLDRTGNAYVGDVTMVPDEVLPLVENKLSEKQVVEQYH